MGLAALSFALLLLSTVSAADVHGRKGETMPLNDGPPGVAWVVQVSDLHVSAFNPERSQALRILLGPVLAMIKPSLVLITGDLIDAKDRARTSSRQDEAEWVEYKSSMDAALKDSGLPVVSFWDIRGNHDTYGVPYAGSPLDYFPRYSFSAPLGRNRSVHSLTLLGKSGWRHLFVGLDQAMQIGLRGPTNLFGHPDDESLQELDETLGQWDNVTSGRITKHVFGHFPMSFTAGTRAGNRVEKTLAKHGVSAYVCGHLHAKFGKHIYRHHQLLLPDMTSAPADFWEWEMGDWRMSRIVRIIAIDEGRTAFTDFRLYAGKNFSDAQNLKVPTVIVPTFPLDSRFMLSKASTGSSTPQSAIRALIFSPESEVSVSVKILDKSGGPDRVVYEQSMHRVSENVGARGPLFEAPWEPEKYMDPSPTRYWLEVTVTSSSNSVLATESRPFSVNNKDAGYRYTWMEFLVMGFEWESFTTWLLYLNLSIMFFIILLLPKIMCAWTKKTGVYEKLVPNLNKDSCVTSLIRLPLWVLMEGVQNPTLWWSEFIVLVYLLFCPWFWGLPLAEGYPVGSFFLWGWTLKPSQSGSVIRNVGVPDNMNVVLPFLYTVLLPLFLLGAALSAERAACETMSRVSEQRSNEVQTTSSSVGVVKVSGRAKIEGTLRPSVSGACPEDALLEKEVSVVAVKKTRCPKRVTRVLLIIGCLVVGYLHLRWCARMASSYGPLAALASPGMAWSVPVLLIIAVCETSALRI